MGWIVRSSLRFRFLVVGAALAMMVVGSLQVQAMRVDVFPEFAPPRVIIETACIGLTTSDVEQLVTVPLEQALNGVKGLETMRSKSVPQLSSIEMVFTQDTDMLHARQLVQERLASIQGQLPSWAGIPSLHPPVSATSRLMQIGMSSKDHSVIAMSMMAYWTIRGRLLRVPGVANVAIWGEQLEMMTVQVDPNKLKQTNTAMAKVMEAVADSVDTGLLKFSSGSVVGSGGNIETAGQRINVRNVLPIVTPEDLSHITTTTRDGTTVPISAVAQV
jgi:Cu/Ag efflux pump CusA